MPEEEKKTSWAPPVEDPIKEAEYEEAKWLAERQAKLDTAALATAYWLEQLVLEQRRINDHIIGGSPAAKTVTKPPRATVPDPTKRSETPVNAEDEDYAIAYYREQLQDILTPDEMEKTIIRVQENEVYMKLPYLGGDKFKYVAGMSKSNDGKYVSDKANSHFILPIPS